MTDPVVSDIASAIHVRHIQTPITAAQAVTATTKVGDVLAHMTRFMYDVTPMFESLRTGPPASGRVTGTLRKSDLEDHISTDEVGQVLRGLADSSLIDANASLVTLLDRFRGGHVFALVVGNAGIEGLVTPSDLNKQAGRTHLFMEVCALELALADRLRLLDQPDEELLGMLSSERVRDVRKRVAKKRDWDEAQTVASLLQSIAT